MSAKQSPHEEYDRGFSNGWDACAARTQPTQPAPAPHQMTLPLDETRLERIESVLAMMHSENCARLKTLEIAVQKLAAMWESLEDDNK